MKEGDQQHTSLLIDIVASLSQLKPDPGGCAFVHKHRFTIEKRQVLLELFLRSETATKLQFANRQQLPSSDNPRILPPKNELPPHPQLCHRCLGRRGLLLCKSRHSLDIRHPADRIHHSFSDIHYYFAPPTVRPVLHRFDKASYFYVYHNPTRQTSRIEIANNPGTSDQDAFNGYLDTCRVINSHRFPTLLTLIVDAVPSTSSQHDHDPDEWRLLSADPRDSGKRKYRLHTLDIYFWAEEDAKTVVETMRGLLDPSQLDVVEAEPEPEPEQTQRHQDTVSPLVQNLENVAVSDPAYRNGQTRNSQNQPQQQPMTVPQNQTLHSPPIQNTSISPVSALSESDKKHQGADQNFAPMAYNPAAPAAPEKIAHREDTPPPPDDGHGTGLTHHDYQRAQSVPWAGTTQPNQFGHYSSPPPQTFGPSAVPSYGGTSPSGVQETRHQSIAAQHYVPSSPGALPQYSQQPVETPGAQFYSTINAGSPHRPLQHNQPQYADYLSHQTPPPGGYSQYNYGQPPQASGQNPYDVHSQVYRPTEAETGGHGHGKKPSRSDAGAKQRVESISSKAEGKLNKFMKKVEKKIG